MAEAVGTASAAITLFDSAIALIQKIKAAREHVRGTSKTLEDTTKKLEALHLSITFLKAEPNLHTASVVSQVSFVLDAGEELRAFFEKLRQIQERRTAQQYLHALTSGNDDDKELAAILSRLDGARAELMLCVQVAGVGLVGDLEKGFRVMATTLDEVNSRVEAALEFKLELFQIVATRPPSEDGTIEVRGTEIARLNRQPSVTREENGSSSARNEDPTPEVTPDSTPNVQTDIYENVTLDQARIMTGDVGVEEWQQRTSRRTAIHHNKLGTGARIMAANVGASAANSFMENFWK
ncbi:hypothetical protein PG991_003592 [Apiospora marii]|uniref:Fungal N-terminal domain-containing protein n=1 Tax=Apiospora marii TaxID=335849 RepID=A0ABR1S4B0_9PEZI